MHQSAGIMLNKPPGTAGRAKAVILGRKEQVGDICRLLENTFSHVTLAETPDELNITGPGKEPFRLAVMTDSFSEKLSIGLLDRVRQKFSPENMICLTRDIEDENEKKLRSAGLIFLGSYGTFFAFADNIINHTLKNGGSKTMKPDIKNAQNLEKRLRKRRGAGRSWKTSLALRTASSISEIAARAVELIVALGIIIPIFIPVLIIRLLTRLPAGKPVFAKRTVYGKEAQPITIRTFSGIDGRMANLPLFLELLTGRLALAGTAIRDWNAPVPDAEQAYLSMIKPGIISLWEIRSTSKIAHEGRQAIEWEYIFNKRPSYDLLLLLRALPAMLYSETSIEPEPVFRLLDLDIENITMQEAVSLMQAGLRDNRQQTICFVNPDCLNKMAGDRDYHDVLKSADRIFPDGIGLIIAGKLLHSPLKENINGTDMLPYLCRMAASEGHSIYLLGGKPGIAEAAAEKIQAEFGVAIAGTSDGYFNHETESSRIIDDVNRSGASILLVAFGAPLQEKWIHRHRSQLRPALLMGVGGLFDFYSGNIRRAPRWMREIGIEWIYRIMQEPGRMWKRYVIGNPLFLYRVMKWKLVTRSSNT